MPDAMTAYQEWWSEEINARAEDARRLMTKGQELVAASSRLLSGPASAAQGCSAS
jgi:hypothetical protein